MNHVPVRLGLSGCSSISLLSTQSSHKQNATDVIEVTGRCLKVFSSCDMLKVRLIKSAYPSFWGAIK